MIIQPYYAMITNFMIAGKGFVPFACILAKNRLFLNDRLKKTGNTLLPVLNSSKILSLT